MFSTARRRNGFAGVHDLWSGTRVVRRLERLRARRSTGRSSPPLRSTRSTSHGSVRRHRHPWPHRRGNPAGRFRSAVAATGVASRASARHAGVAPRIRDLNRPGRLRWLGGRRTSTDNWDAYEALDGERGARARSPAVVGRGETVAGGSRARDRRRAERRIARSSRARSLWITGDGRAKLLDFRAPGAPIGPTPDLTRIGEAGADFLGRGRHQRPHRASECSVDRRRSTPAAMLCRCRHRRCWTRSSAVA